MAKQLIECIPNFSEGQDSGIIENIVSQFRKFKGCHLLDYRADKDHNRLVVTVIGSPLPIQEALLEASKVAIANINMESHKGSHPRIGTVDVIPFTPLQNISMEECVKIVNDFGKLYYEQTKVPVYFYEESALESDRKQLEVIRKGEFEGLKLEIKNNERHPDIGKPQLHPSAGATIIGARKSLIAFNVNLGTDDITIAQKIAKSIRSSNGGLSCVKGIGVPLKERNLVQVSMNITDYKKNGLYRVLELIRVEAKRFGVAVVETEIYGMVPADAILDSSSYYMQIADFDVRQVIELRLLEMMKDDES